MNEEVSNKISIISVSGKYFLWNEKDVLYLRKTHRICGSAVGSLPRKPWQNSVYSLPIILMPEEVCLCVSKGLADVCKGGKDYFVKKRKIEDVDEFESSRNMTEEEQIRTFKSEKLEKSRLYYGKGKGKHKKEFKNKKICNEDVVTVIEKVSAENDKTTDKQNELKYTLHTSNGDLPTDSKMIVDKEEDSGNASKNLITITEEDKKYFDHSVRVHIPTSVKPINEKLFSKLDFNYPSTDREKLCYAVFYDLWTKGHYITSAEKFGGDFLVYMGDPLRYHSNFIVIVLNTNESLTSQQMIYYGRLGSSVKKTVALVKVETNPERISYISLSWTSI